MNTQNNELPDHLAEGIHEKPRVWYERMVGIFILGLLYGLVIGHGWAS